MWPINYFHDPVGEVMTYFGGNKNMGICKSPCCVLLTLKLSHVSLLGYPLHCTALNLRSL